MLESINIVIKLDSNNNIIAWKIEYNNKDVIGRGSFGIVFSGSFQNSDVAVKRIELVRLDGNDDREEEALRRLDHPNVVKLLHCEDQGEFRYVISLYKREAILYLHLKQSTGFTFLSCALLLWTKFFFPKTMRKDIEDHCQATFKFYFN